MSSLRSALQELQSEEVGSLGHSQLEADLQELERLSDVLLSEKARRVAVIDRRESWRKDGFTSCVAWAVGKLRMGYSKARELVGIAQALEEMPETKEALAEGEVSSSAVAVLVQAKERNPEEFGASESELVQKAERLPVSALRSEALAWGMAADGRVGAEERAERMHERRRLDVAPTVEGTTAVRGELDAESGAVVDTAIRAVVDTWVRSGHETRSPAQLRADALVFLSRHYLEGADRGAVAGERPHLIITVPLEVLEKRVGGSAELAGTGPITAETARRLACDASVSRVITTGASEPLDVGRQTPVVPAGLRKAVMERDKGCRFCGCERPALWCDVHHVVHWADGGKTKKSNLILLCRPHHRMAHHGFTVKMIDGNPRFFRPDGAALEDRAPP